MISMAFPNPFRNLVRKEQFEKVKHAFLKIKDDLEEHLDGINQNTNEIQSNYEYLCKLGQKLDAIKERLEAVQVRLNELDTGEKPGRIDLSHEEKKVFLTIYKYSTPKRFISYSDVSKKLGIPISLVRFFITNLIEKDVPIVKKYRNREVLVGLDDEFRELQAKENIVNINESITRYI